jgi:recombination protein RecT
MASALRLASTVILARNHSDEGLEVLMLRRSAKSPFMPGAFVFPGGAVDPADYEPGRTPGWSDERIERAFRARAPGELPVDQPPVTLGEGRALIAAATRELEEEASIGIAPAALELFSHWITPAGEPRRYNTHFFVAAAPAGANGTADAHETHDAQWLAPARALRKFRDGELHLVFPTIKHLERLAAFGGVDALLAFAREKPILTIMPELPPDADPVLPGALEGRW